MQTRGPFNKSFLNPPHDAGFSIDVKPRLRTLLFSGIVVLKVSTDRGLGVLCLNVRKGTDFVHCIHWHMKDEEEWYLVSHNYEKNLNGSDIILRDTHFSWTRVLGIYDVPEREFR